MIECVFTIDYEIYGNGEGGLRELVYEPAERLMAVFRKKRARFVAFVEVAELELLEAAGADPASALVRRQVRDLRAGGFELGLHLHPQWYNARFDNGRWELDYGEYNLCTLGRERIAQIVDRALRYFRVVLDEPDFTPRSFRAGNWLFQPTQPAATVLAERGIKVDSSVFKGGRQSLHGLDYRRARRNGYYWRFGNRVDVPDDAGAMLELPIYTRPVPFWRMITAKRVGLQGRAPSAGRSGAARLHRLLDIARFMYPLKLDFCRMTIDELTRAVDTVRKRELRNPRQYRPIVAIGHTKDLRDLKTVDSFLSYLERAGVPVSTMEAVACRCTNGVMAGGQETRW